jgi:phage shock protein PspC (stress-responsive transcriptional regulator)
VSFFTGGRITDNLGAFIQGTDDGVARRFGWDNTDIRYAASVNVDGHNLLWE